jgi:hypothetical protein
MIEDNFTNKNMTIYNPMGQVIRTINQISGNKYQLKRGNLSSGVYYLVVETSDNKVLGTYKIIVSDWTIR